MTEAQAEILCRVRWDSQARESDFHVAEVTRCCGMTRTAACH